jgi:hypothetical protein
VRIYARIKLDTRSAGLWPAVWTYGVGDDWPKHGEIDIFEAAVFADGVSPDWYQTNYFYGTDPNVNLVVDEASDPIDLPSDNLYHVVMVEWTPNTLRFDFDGVTVDFRVCNWAWHWLQLGGTPPSCGGSEYLSSLWNKRPGQRIVLNLAYGGGFFGDTPPFTPPAGGITYGATMKVDWVKVFVQPR